METESSAAYMRKRRFIKAATCTARKVEGTVLRMRRPQDKEALEDMMETVGR